MLGKTKRDLILTTNAIVDDPSGRGYTDLCVLKCSMVVPANNFHKEKSGKIGNKYIKWLFKDEGLQFYVEFGRMNKKIIIPEYKSLSQVCNYEDRLNRLPSYTDEYNAFKILENTLRGCFAGEYDGRYSSAASSWEWYKHSPECNGRHPIRINQFINKDGVCLYAFQREDDLYYNFFYAYKGEEGDISRLSDIEPFMPGGEFDEEKYLRNIGAY